MTFASSSTGKTPVSHTLCWIFDTLSMGLCDLVAYHNAPKIVQVRCRSRAKTLKHIRTFCCRHSVQALVLRLSGADGIVI